MNLLLALWLIVSALTVSAQDARESLGPKDKPAQAKGPHPLTELMATLNSTLRPELRGKHPRVYITDAEIVKLRERSRTTHRDLWQRALRQVRALKNEPPAPPAQERRVQNEVGIGIAEAALAYKIEGDKKYLEVAKKYLEAAVSYDIWGYAYNKPNVDLAAGRLLYRMAARFRDAEAQGVAAWMEGLDHYNAEDYWSLLWYDSAIPVVSIHRQQPWHYFSDHEVVFWRSDWTPQAVAFAFKCGPPEGHHTKDTLKAFPDWHLSAGHAHPDANSFIIYAGGRYLTGDTGYAGLPMTEQHNTILIDGAGRAREGKGHDVFADVSYDRLDQIRFTDVKLEPRFAYVRGEAAAAYEDNLGAQRFTRNFLFTAPGDFVVWDDVATREARRITSLLRADERLELIGKNQFLLQNGQASLRATIVEPEAAVAKVEANTLTAAGQPGSVDNGPRQERGLRLAASASAPAMKTRFVMLLKVEVETTTN